MKFLRVGLISLLFAVGCDSAPKESSVESQADASPELRLEIESLKAEKSRLTAELESAQAKLRSAEATTAKLAEQITDLKRTPAMLSAELEGVELKDASAIQRAIKLRDELVSRFPDSSEAKSASRKFKSLEAKLRDAEVLAKSDAIAARATAATTEDAQRAIAVELDAFLKENRGSRSTKSAATAKRTVDTALRKIDAERKREARAECRARKQNASLRCCDGSLSPTCECYRSSHRGCCSHHGGICGCEQIDCSDLGL